MEDDFDDAGWREAQGQSDWASDRHLDDLAEAEQFKEEMKRRREVALKYIEEFGPPTKENFFRKLGSGKDSGWLIIFEGKEGYFSDSDGLNYICYLLRTRNGERISVSDLYYALKGRVKEETNFFDPNILNKKVETYNNFTPGSVVVGNEILDEETIKNIKKEIKSLIEQEKDEKQRGGTGEAYRLQKEELEEYLLKNIGGKSGKRKFTENEERIRKTVTNRIKDSIKIIGEQNLLLGQFLEKSIFTGSSCYYSPRQTEIKWHF